jgi:hypothetical protein
MKIILFILFLFSSFNVYPQNHRIPQRMYNHSLAYGPRSGGTFYSIGYEFSKENTNASVGLGYGRIMLGLNMFSPDLWVLNGNTDEVYASVNYVYRNKDYEWFMLVGGVGGSVDMRDQILIKVGIDIELSYPSFLTINFYQTNQSRFMVGLKIIIF